MGPKAQELYQTLGNAGIEVLFDDRAESAGVKFNDADLLGIPSRMTISPRTVAHDAVEVKGRTEKDPRLVPFPDIVAHLRGRGR